VRDSGDHLPAAGGDGLAGAAPEGVAAGGDGLAGSAPDGPPVIYTIGHSTRPIDELIALLEGAGVRRLVDVRSVPRSRRNPQFEGPALARALNDSGIEYRHERALGGFRRPVPGSPNRGWEHPAFQGYADYMATPEFDAALGELTALAREVPTCIMCAEAQWWRCHRRLVSDALLIRGWEVLHLGLRAEPVAHELTPFAVVGPGHTITYPPAQGELEVE
jgi:uncharacterized protein (DUF488 family)